MYRRGILFRPTSKIMHGTFLSYELDNNIGHRTIAIEKYQVDGSRVPHFVVAGQALCPDTSEWIEYVPEGYNA